MEYSNLKKKMQILLRQKDLVDFEKRKEKPKQRVSGSDTSFILEF